MVKQGCARTGARVAVLCEEDGLDGKLLDGEGVLAPSLLDEAVNGAPTPSRKVSALTAPGSPGSGWSHLSSCAGQRAIARGAENGWDSPQPFLRARQASQTSQPGWRVSTVTFAH